MAVLSLYWHSRTEFSLSNQGKPLFPSLLKAWKLQDFQIKKHEGPALLLQAIFAVREVLLNERHLVKTGGKVLASGCILKHPGSALLPLLVYTLDNKIKIQLLAV